MSVNARRRLIVIGGDAAGMSAASQARRRIPPDELDIVAFERSPHVSYSACGLPYLAGGLIDDEMSLVVRSPEEFQSKHAIEARTLHEVVHLDPGSKEVRVTDFANGEESVVPYDVAVLATGTEAVRPKLDGIDAAGVFGLTTLQSGIELRSAIDDARPSRAVVVGGGYIGLEMAEAFVERGISTVLVEARPQPMPSLDVDMGELVSDALRGLGVEVRLGEEVEGFEQTSGRVSAVATRAGSMPVDIVALGLGTRPNVDLALKAGLRMGESGAVWVDDRMKTSAPGVWAAGDCAEQMHRVTGTPVNFHLGTIANKMGRVAGTNIGGEDLRFPGVLGTAATRVGSTEIARTGLSDREAEAAGLEHVSAIVRSRTGPRYFPGSERVTIKVTAQRDTGRLLGAQIVGGRGSAKRIDVFAAALWAGLDLEQMQFMDLAYAPPFATVWDAILVAVRRALEALA